MNIYTKGHEPRCPIQGPQCRGIVRTRGARACHPCSRLRAAPPPIIAPDPALKAQAEAEKDFRPALLAALKKQPATIVELAARVGCSAGQALDELLALQRRGLNVRQFGDAWSIEKQPEAGPGKAIEPYVSRADGTFFFGWLGDNHAGSKYARLDALQDTYRRFEAAGVDRVFHTGNWIDGEAEFNKYDLLVHGMDAQIAYLANEYPIAKGLTTYAVAGRDHEGWYGKREGIDIGRHAELLMHEAGRLDWRHLGYMESFVPLQHVHTGKTSMLHVMHPGGGSAYAVSYTVQKIVEGYEGGSKPAVLLAGHYHKLEFLNTRNVWVLQTGCLQDITPFARQKKLRFELGAGTCRLEQDPETGAIVACAIQMWCYFDRAYYNNRFSDAGPATLTPRTARGRSLL